MTVAEDTAAKINTKNTQLTAIISEKDTDTLDLANTVDQQLATSKALSGDNTRLTGELQTMTQNRNTLQTEFNSYKTKYPPVIVTPPPGVKRRTLHGLGGGNGVRPGIDLDRRYYGPNDKTKMITDTGANEGRGTVSWNSMKFPYPWVDMAGGKGDAWFVDIMKAVSEGIKPKVDDPDDVDEVWFSGHHEPEGDQLDERLWRTTQERLSLLVPGGSEGPIKLWLTTTGWNQEFNTGAAAALVDWANLFPKNGDVFGIAYDSPYNTYGRVWNKATGTITAEMNSKVTDPFVYVDALATRAKQFGVEAALGEWGYSDEMHAKDPAWRDKVMDRCITNPIQQLLGEAYFDTKLNSTRSWYLGAGSTPKRVGHMAAMASRKGK